MNGSATAIDLYRECRVTAFEGGLEAALDLLASEFPPASPVGHGGRVMVPEPLLARIDGARVSGAYPTDTGTLVLAETDLSASDRDWRVGVAWARIGAVERLGRRATDRLARRRIGNSATIALPLVRAAVGDVATALGQAVALLECPAPQEHPSSLIEREIGLALRTAWRFFGASGYVVDTTSHMAQAIEVLSDVYAIDAGGER